MVYLVGKLEIKIEEAKNLLNMDSSMFSSECKSDPYCIIDLESSTGSKRIGKTAVIENCLNPIWNYTTVAEVIEDDVRGLAFIVKDKDSLGAEIIGSRFLKIDEFWGRRRFDGFIQLTSALGKPAGEVKVQIHYVPYTKIDESLHKKCVLQ